MHKLTKRKENAQDIDGSGEWLMLEQNFSQHQNFVQPGIPVLKHNIFVPRVHKSVIHHGTTQKNLNINIITFQNLIPTRIRDGSSGNDELPGPVDGA